MIRMIQCLSAEQAKEYHRDELLRSDYYLNDQELKGTFRGRLAKRIGMKGEASKEAFERLCDNIHPLTGRPLTPGRKVRRTVGYDINFHCPKSVSVLHVLSKDNHIVDAFRAAVQETMQDIETDSKTTVRKNKQTGERQTGELIWAEFIHQTARPIKGTEPDPHLHCHCFTFNATWDQVEKQFKAGQFGDIKRDMPYYEARFHKRLADQLVGLGYQVRRTKISFEVVGVPDAVIDLFSKRTKEIIRIAKEKNITDPRALDQLGAKSREKKKKGQTMAQLRQDWIRQIRALGMAEDGSGSIRFAKDRPSNLVTATACVDHAVAHKFERASVVQDRRLLEAAYRFAIGRDGVSVDDITARFKRDARFIRVKEGARMMCTTKEILAEERRMVALAQAGKGKLPPLYLQQPAPSLEGEQRAAALHLLTTTDRVSMVRGGAGTGKTTMMREIVAMIEKAGCPVIVVAPTAQASRGVLRQEGFQEAETVAKLLNDPALQALLENAVLWVDEAGLLGVRDMTAILELAEAHNARVILSGDTRQHAAVVRGDALRVLNTVAGIIPAQVNKIYRQRNQEYKEAVQELSQGNIKCAFDKLTAIGAVKEMDQNNPYQPLVGTYVTALQKGKTVLAVSPTHKIGDEVTAALRTKLRELGRLGKKENLVPRLVNLNLTEGEKTDPFHYQAGLIVQFNQNRPGVLRGSMWTVDRAEGKTVTLTNKEGKTLDLPLADGKYFDVFRKTEIGLSKGDAIAITRNAFDQNRKRLDNGSTLEVVDVSPGKITARNTNSGAVSVLPEDFGHLAHAYCLTSHASQGKTVDEVFIAQPAATFPATDMKQFYVSVSRGRDRVHIYTDDINALLDHVSESGDRISASELVAPKKPMVRPFVQRKRQDLTLRPMPVKKPSIPSPLPAPIRPHAPKPV